MLSGEKWDAYIHAQNEWFAFHDYFLRRKREEGYVLMSEFHADTLEDNRLREITASRWKELSQEQKDTYNRRKSLT